MNSISKKDLKIISYDFRSLSNRVLNCNVENGVSLIRRLVEFIDSTEVIRDYVHGYADKHEFAPPEKQQRYLYLGDSLEEEIAEGYHYFKYIAENCTDFYFQVTIGYGGKGNNGVKEFCNKLVHPFVSDIIEYLTRIEIKMGYDEESKYFIIANGENIQLNIAEQGAVQNNKQINSIDTEELEKLLLDIRRNTTAEINATVEECIETIRYELSQSKPKKSLIKTAATTLKGIKGTAEFMAAAAALYQFIMPFFQNMNI